MGKQKRRGKPGTTRPQASKVIQFSREEYAERVERINEAMCGMFDVQSGLETFSYLIEQASLGDEEVDHSTLDGLRVVINGMAKLAHEAGDLLDLPGGWEKSDIDEESGEESA